MSRVQVPTRVWMRTNSLTEFVKKIRAEIESYEDFEDKDKIVKIKAFDLLMLLEYQSSYS